MKMVTVIVMALALALIPTVGICHDQAEYQRLLLERLEWEFQFHQARQEVLKYKFREAQAELQKSEQDAAKQPEEAKQPEVQPLH